MKAKILNELKIKKMNVIGKIVEIKEKQTFTSAAGKEWEKINFVVKTNEEYNNTYFFELFGDKCGLILPKDTMVNVHFNISCREYKDTYFTSLSVWKMEEHFTDDQQNQMLGEIMEHDTMKALDDLTIRPDDKDTGLPF
jgi:hypothetical protein